MRIFGFKVYTPWGAIRRAGKELWKRRKAIEKVARKAIRLTPIGIAKRARKIALREYEKHRGIIERVAHKAIFFTPLGIAAHAGARALRTIHKITRRPVKHVPKPNVSKLPGSFLSKLIIHKPKSHIIHKPSVRRPEMSPRPQYLRPQPVYKPPVPQPQMAYSSYQQPQMQYQQPQTPQYQQPPMKMAVRSEKTPTKNNLLPILAIAGGIAAFMLLKKK